MTTTLELQLKQYEHLKAIWKGIHFIATQSFSVSSWELFVSFLSTSWPFRKIGVFPVEAMLRRGKCFKCNESNTRHLPLHMQRKKSIATNTF